MKKKYSSLVKTLRKGITLSALILTAIVANAQEIRFVMSGTSFTVADIQGAGIEVTGIDGGQSVNIGTNVNQVYTAQNGATVTFRGNITLLNIVAGSIASADLSNAPATLKVFTLNNTNTSTVNLSGATNLEQLSLRCGISHADLTNLPLLRVLRLGKLGEEKTWNLKTVTFPNPNVIQVLDLTNTSFTDVNNLNNLPELKQFTAVGTHLTGELALRASSKLETVFVGRTSQLTSVDLSNRPLLKNVLLAEAGPTTVNLSNNPTLASGTVELRDMPVTTLNLSNCGLRTTSNIDFTKLSGLSNLNLSGNNFSADVWVALINNLDAARRAEGAMLTTSAADEALLSQEIKNLLDSKGWGLNGTPTDIKSSQAGIIKVSVGGRTVQMQGLKANADVKVYAISGMQVATVQADADGVAWLDLVGQALGTYVVVADGFAQRVVVR